MLKIYPDVTSAAQHVIDEVGIADICVDSTKLNSKLVIKQVKVGAAAIGGTAAAHSRCRQHHQSAEGKKLVHPRLVESQAPASQLQST